MVAQQITVTEPPVLAATETAPLAYIQGDPATPITASMIAADVNNTIAGAIVWISGNYQSNQDVLAFANTATITGTWDSAYGVLFLNGDDTVADYQSALRIVTYFDSSPNPDPAVRTISFLIYDSLNYSNDVSRQIQVIPVVTWSGNSSGILSNPANWVGGEAPNPAVDDLVLGGTASSSPVNDFAAGSEFTGLTFMGNCNLSGNSILLTGTISNAQGADNLALPVVLGSDEQFDVSSGTLGIAGAVDNSGYLLTVAVAAGSAATIVGPVSGAGGLVKSGMGSLALSARTTTRERPWWPPALL